MSFNVTQEGLEQQRYLHMKVLFLWCFTIINWWHFMTLKPMCKPRFIMLMYQNHHHVHYHYQQRVQDQIKHDFVCFCTVDSLLRRSTRTQPRQSGILPAWSDVPTSLGSTCCNTKVAVTSRKTSFTADRVPGFHQLGRQWCHTTSSASYCEDGAWGGGGASDWWVITLITLIIRCYTNIQYILTFSQQPSSVFSFAFMFHTSHLFWKEHRRQCVSEHIIH